MSAVLSLAASSLKRDQLISLVSTKAYEKKQRCDAQDEQHHKRWGYYCGKVRQLIVVALYGLVQLCLGDSFFSDAQWQNLLNRRGCIWCDSSQIGELPRPSSLRSPPPPTEEDPRTSSFQVPKSVETGKDHRRRCWQQSERWVDCMLPIAIGMVDDKQICVTA